MEKRENVDDGKKQIISTGHPEIDKRLGGGLPVGSLTLIEGQSDAGKSVLCQQMIWGSLGHGCRVILFTTENTTRSLITQMDSLGLGILDYLLLGRLKIFYMKPSQIKQSPGETYGIILDTVEKYPQYELIVVDALTHILSVSSDVEIMGYFERCKALCDQRRTVINVTHNYALNNDVLSRLRSACDAHLRLMIEKIGDKLVKTLEVAKIRGAAQTTGNIITFEVEPEVGMKIMPLSRAKA
jgi:archaeal flagellar protein FlaH